MSWSAFFKTPGLHWPSRIFRLRKIGRPASCKVESWRVNVQSCLVEILPIVNAFLRRSGPLLGRGPRLGLLRLLGDLGDEEPLLADQLLRFLLGRGVDRVLDLPPGVVHRLVLVGRHGVFSVVCQWSVVLVRFVSVCESISGD